MDYADFDALLSAGKATSADRAVCILWLAKTIHSVEGMTASEIAKIIEKDCGHPGQNVSRLNSQLNSDRRTARHGRNGFRLTPAASRVLAEKYSCEINAPSSPKIVASGGVIPQEIFAHCGRSYLIRLVDQVNGCFHNAYFDGLMVLARKLLETLAIEAYVQDGRAQDVKRPDDSFLQFDDLIGKLSSDNTFNISRETKKTLALVKKYGDQSAHNQRFTARQSDIDEIKPGLRIAAEELLNHCHFPKPA